MYLIKKTVYSTISNENNVILYESDSDIETEDKLYDEVDFETVCPFCFNVIFKALSCCYCGRSCKSSSSNNGKGKNKKETNKSKKKEHNNLKQQLEMTVIQNEDIGNYQRVKQFSDDESCDIKLKIVFVGMKTTIKLERIKRTGHHAIVTTPTQYVCFRFFVLIDYVFFLWVFGVNNNINRQCTSWKIMFASFYDA